jgi:tagatose-1,6-bisphosphate aldolase non-catalytic subunit AgaZ/GatZ
MKQNSYKVASELKTWIRERKASLLCTGPMSRTIVDVCLEIAKQYQFPVPLIASRRQIEAKKFGGGYVNNWSTSDFADYVLSRDQTGFVILARDHGGPFQNIFEQKEGYSLQQAMASAKHSFEEDIDAGFHILHLDPSVPMAGENLTLQMILDRLFELYSHCFEYAQKKGKNVQFELGTEEQSGYGQDLEAFEYFLNQTNSFCKTNKITLPLFVVAQTGTKVLETENVGKVAHYPDNTEVSYIENLKSIVKIAERNQLMVKEHNADYICGETLQLRPLVGMHACNVAPEFGVAETRALIYSLSFYHMKKELDEFLAVSYESGKWKKWMKTGTKATDFDRSVIAGHYVFSDPRVGAVREKLQREMAKQGQSLEFFLKQSIKASILRYCLAFNMM